MSDVSTSAPAKPKKTPKTDRKVVAKREWLDSNGKKISVGDLDVAAVRYTYLATGRTVDYIIGAYPKLDAAFAAMGAVTKLGNIVNTVINADDYNGTDDPMDDVVAWLAAAQSGQWREESPGPKGPKYDKDVIAGVLVDLLSGKPGALDYQGYREKLDSDLSWYAKVRAQPEVMAEYMKRMAAKGAPAGGIDSLLG